MYVSERYNKKTAITGGRSSSKGGKRFALKNDGQRKIGRVPVTAPSTRR